MPRSAWLLSVAALGAILAGCASATTAPGWTAAPVDLPAGPAANATVVSVYKSPTCACCHEWEAYLRAHGWSVRSIPVDDLTQVKAERGIPMNVASCHTAIVEGYFVEGHVPLAAIQDLLRQRPAIDGIALPGMPDGSPGMPGVKAGPFSILAVDGGRTSDFGSY